MPVFLFDHETRSVFEGTFSTEAGEYPHIFGGNATRCGVSNMNLDPPLHFLFGLSTQDPSVRQVAPKYDGPLLPVFFGFSYPNEAGYVYRHVGNEIKIKSPRDLQYDHQWFGDEFPSLFQAGFLHFTPYECDVTRAVDALEFAAIFGLDHLADEELETAIEYVRRETDLFQAWHMLDCSDKELVDFAYIEPFWQRKPSAACRSRQLCRRDTLRVIAILNPDDEIPCDAQIILQHCKDCGCFTTTYQCT